MDNKDELELSDSQIDAIKMLKADVSKAVIRYDADIEIAAIDVMSGLHENPVDVDAVNAVLETKYEAKLAKAKTVVDGIAKLKSTLDDDQYMKLKEIYGRGDKSVCPKS